MRYFTSQTSTCILLSLSSLLSLTLTLPTSEADGSHFVKRQNGEFDEEYDFIVTGGKLDFLTTVTRYLLGGHYSD